jgi:ketosteroid isomerase-like protein
MATQTGTQLEQLVRDGYAALDRLDRDAMIGGFAEDARLVDELSGWRYGRDEITEYIKSFPDDLDSHTTLSDVAVEQWDDTAILTGMVEQTYRLEGEPRHGRAPLTVVFRRRDGEWKVVLMHVVALPEHA